MTRWAKIFTLGDPRVKNIFDDPVWITEKLDGSQINFGVGFNNELWIRSKGAVISLDNPQDLFVPAVNYILKIRDLLPTGFSFHGEAFKNNKHNTLCYARHPKNHIALYGVINSDYRALNEEEILKWAEKLDLEMVPLLASNIRINKSEDVKEFLNIPSALGNVNAEGIVIKNYNKKLFFNGNEYPLLQAKIVTEQFKEKHKENFQFKDPISRILSCYPKEAVENRWKKVIQHRKENSSEPLSVKDIGPLLGEIFRDFEEEEKENIKHQLWQGYKRTILNHQVVNFPQWFKDYIAFESDNMEYKDE